MRSAKCRSNCSRSCSAPSRTRSSSASAAIARIRTDVRFVAATNRDLKAMVDENKFRADLYYRLHVFPLNVPPLRERREDIPLLTRYFVQKHAQRMGRKIESIPTQALEALTNYDWPGNIRELQNVIERSVILSNGPELRVWRCRR